MNHRLEPTVCLDQVSVWAEQAKAVAAQGQVNQRILRLAHSDPAWFAVQIEGQSGAVCALGDTERAFSLMSVIKPFLLLYLLEHYGPDKVFSWVGMVPSELPFNSLEQLIADGGRPRNPMINSGAIALAARLPGDNGDDCAQRFCQWLNQQAGCRLALDIPLLASVRQVGRQTNQTLVRHLVKAGQVQHPELALDVYEQICCLAGQAGDLARLGRLLAFDSEAALRSNRCAVNALMLTCGLYEASAAYAVRIGLPMKSGISGALLAVVPGWGAIATYSPALDPVGNPIAGLAFVEQMATALRLSRFG